MVFIIVMLFAATALAGGPPQVTSAVTSRVGLPLNDSLTVIGTVNPEEIGTGRSPADTADPVLDVTLDKQQFEKGEPVILRTFLHRKDGTPVEGNTVHVWDNDKREIKAEAKGQGKHTATLDNSPGDHLIEVYSDAIVNGNSVHRATTHFYNVATSTFKVLDVGAVHTEGPWLVVPLKVVCAERGAHVEVGASLAAGNIVVATANVAAFFDAGESILDVKFALSDLVEAGPYRVVNVGAVQRGPGGTVTVAAPGTVGRPFNPTRQTTPESGGGGRFDGYGTR